MKKLIPVTVVSGFLGSGKTTLLCDLLRRRQERRLAVLINELGEVSIDGALARASTAGTKEVEIVDFPSGLIAYAEDDQFVPTLQAIARRSGQVDHVLIETSGVALPTAAMARLQSADLVEDFVLDATLVVVDTPRLLAGQFGKVWNSKSGNIATETGGDFGRGGAGSFGEGKNGRDAVALLRTRPTDVLLVDVSREQSGGAGEARDTADDGDGARRAVDANSRDGDGAGRTFDRDGRAADGVRCTLDAGDQAGSGTQAAGRDVAESIERLFELQLRAADVVVLNKVDELNADALLIAEEQVRRRAPNVRFLELAHRAGLDVRVALGLRLHQATGAGRAKHFHGPFAPMPAAGSFTLADHGRVDGHSHSGLLAHMHGLATHTHFHEQDPGWLSFTLRSGELQRVGVLRTALERVAETEPLLRCKGFALGSENGRPVLLQGVRTRVVATEQVPRAQLSESELVFIGYHLSRSRVASMLSQMTGTAWS
jgi:G3E family GTPase